MAISVWTMLLDVLVLIAPKRTTWYDRAMLAQIESMLRHVEKIVEHMGEADDGR